MARIGMASVYSQGKSADPIYGMANQEARAINKVFIASGGDAYLDLGVANMYIYFGIIPFKRWRVIGLGMYWIEGSTVDEDPVVEYGRYGDNDAYAKMTSAITGGEKFNITDHQKLDPLGLLAPEKIIETSATLVTTWTIGAQFNKWNEDTKSLKVSEAAVAGMTTGQVRPYMLIEVDTGGKW